VQYIRRGTKISINEIVEKAKFSKIKVPFHYTKTRNGTWKFDKQQNLPIDESFLDKINQTDNVYLIFNNGGRVVYVGKAKNAQYINTTFRVLSP